MAIPCRPRSLSILLLTLALIWSLSAFCQTESATISGTVTDQSGAVLANADVKLTNVETSTVAETISNNLGLYVFPNVRPGRYRMLVQKTGFRQIVLTDMTVNVQDVLSRNFSLQVGVVGESITVSGDAAQVNTTDGSVSTVVDRKFLEDIPLNGRSLQTLLMLTPGVQFVESSTDFGQFSVNGQRTTSNYFTVDGVAANISSSNGNGMQGSATGSNPGFNAMGTTTSLISVDAIQEFRVQTSTFAPEYGRSPGAQVSMASRSGTNSWHGTAFEYLRNDLFDANDWFSDNEKLPKAKERQNDFGGVLGGPVRLPGLYNGKDKTFFFFSYEGLRLQQPVNLEGYVPDNAARAAVPQALKPFVDVYPIQNGPEVGHNMAEYRTGASDPTTLDAFSIRLDQSIGSKFQVFGRYNYSPNTVGTYGFPPFTDYLPNQEQLIKTKTNTLTLGLDEVITNRIGNELRLNYSNVKFDDWYQVVPMGGGMPVSNATLAQILPPGTDPSAVYLYFAIYGYSLYSAYQQGPAVPSEQRQGNLVDNLTLVKGDHQLKFGVDYRILSPFQGSIPYGLSVRYNGVGSVLSNQPGSSEVFDNFPAGLRTRQFSLYAQDTWKMSRRLTLTYGLRWDVDPAPHGANLESDPLVIESINNLAAMTVAPPGTNFYATTWKNFAPRLGAAYQMRQSSNTPTVIRGGVGTFYETAGGDLGFYSFGNLSNANYFSTFPAPLQQAGAPSPLSRFSRPYGGGYVAEPNLVLPRTYQWNVAIEQGLGPNQTLTTTYVGSAGHDLLRDSDFSNDGVNPNFQYYAFFDVTNNSGNSNYQALQTQFRRNASHGLQALVSYTYSHSIDNNSQSYNGSTPGILGSTITVDRGNSDFDVRHSFSGAVIYALPAPARSGLAHATLGGWSVDDLVIARTAQPVDLLPDYFQVGPYSYSARPNVVPGVPFYLYGSQYPGGKRFNPAAFSDAAPGTQGDLGRNTLRGFPAWQDNFAIHRQFNLADKVNLQLRAECFNLFNHPNFYQPLGFNSLQDPNFGISQATLANGLSFNGMNALYQIGAPRSWQFALRLEF